METKYKLFIILDHADETLANKVWEFGGGWPLLKHHGGRLIDAAEYAKLVESGEIEHRDYWCVKKGYGIIVNTHAMTYTTTVDQLRQGMTDFIRGWYEAKAN